MPSIQSPETEGAPVLPYTIEMHSGGPLTEVEEFWYSVYVKEMGLELSTADHRTRRIVDPFTEGGHQFIARDHEGRVAGTILVVLGRERDLGFYRELYELTDDVANVSLSSKMLIAPDARKSRLAFSLAVEAYRYGAPLGIQVDYCDSQRVTLPFFRRLGYRRMPGVSEHPIYGPSIRMRLDGFDQAHLDACGSPFARELRAFTQSPELPPAKAAMQV